MAPKNIVHAENFAPGLHNIWRGECTRFSKLHNKYNSWEHASDLQLIGPLLSYDDDRDRVYLQFSTEPQIWAHGGHSIHTSTLVVLMGFRWFSFAVLECARVIDVKAHCAAHFCAVVIHILAMVVCTVIRLSIGLLSGTKVETKTGSTAIVLTSVGDNTFSRSG